MYECVCVSSVVMLSHCALFVPLFSFSVCAVWIVEIITACGYCIKISKKEEELKKNVNLPSNDKRCVYIVPLLTLQNYYLILKFLQNLEKLGKVVRECMTELTARFTLGIHNL